MHFCIHRYSVRLEVKDTVESPPFDQELPIKIYPWLPGGDMAFVSQAGGKHVSKAQISTYQRWLRQRLFPPTWTLIQRKIWWNIMEYNEIWWSYMKLFLREILWGSILASMASQALPPDVNRLALFPSLQVPFVPCVDVFTKLEVFLVELGEKWHVWWYS